MLRQGTVFHDGVRHEPIAQDLVELTGTKDSVVSIAFNLTQERCMFGRMSRQGGIVAFDHDALFIVEVLTSGLFQLDEDITNTRSINTQVNTLDEREDLPVLPVNLG
jgi:hypothetical protein